MGKGTMITLKIPLTLAIIEGMNVKVGSSRYTIPITAIKESFSPKENDCFKEPGGNEMIMVRGECYSIVRLHEFYSVQTEIKDFHKGVLIMVEQDEKEFCIFTDGVIGKQQVVIKTLPNYINSLKKIRGIAGCTLLGDGGISLILDVGTLYGYNANREERNS
jgi:two-component system chemotaxis sensor kinase CheA